MGALYRDLRGTVPSSTQGSNTPPGVSAVGMRALHHFGGVDGIWPGIGRNHRAACLAGGSPRLCDADRTRYASLLSFRQPLLLPP
ncbi:hypothetical protein GCM10008957_35870 [Deinococcus ruber]|uniref:Uncharacterized protein n=1 Tax=Deinococcus ruber TaxID=1848197 RepID=A0A918CFU8_9DEIO|nr:hypothetical protein GCM10008957_35870 [Deinococcus ruber]